MNFRRIHQRAIAAVLTLTLVCALLGVSRVTYAAAATTLSDTLSRLKASTLADHDFRFVTPTGVDASTDTITFTFPAGFTMGTFNVNNVDFAVGSTGNCTTASFTDKTIAASAGSSIWGAAQSGQVITLTAPTNAASGEVTAGRCVQLQEGANATFGASGASQITNPSSTGTARIDVAGTFGDTGSATVVIITDDQVQISATVDQTITFSISANSIQFGTVSSASARYATTSGGSGSETSAHTLAAGTNAANGYQITVDGATLTNGSFTITAIGGTAAASSPGSEQFGMRYTASGGSGSVSSPFNTANYAYNDAAPPDQIASSSTSSATTTYTAYYLANVSGATEPGTYN
ncbi:MAG: hypothetical protein U0514_02890, partial [Candidatus Andersenbacteria bacterium]